MSNLSSTVTRVDASATLEMKALTNRLVEKGADVVDMSAGSPDFVTPDHIREGAKTALDDGKTHTTVSKGIPELREEIARKFREDNDIETETDRVIVTVGSKSGIFQTLFSLLDDGDEVVVLDPAWVSYPSMVRMLGGTVKRLQLDPTTGFTLGDTDISEAVSNDTEALILNNPANPSGAVFSRKELSVIRDLAVDHDFYVIADEIYEKIVFGATHHSIGAMGGMADRTITVNGFSKSYAMTGWRLGYLTGPEHVVTEIAKIQSHTVSCPTSFAQHGALQALVGPQSPVDEMREIYRERVETLFDELRHVDVDVPRPDGAFYGFVPVRSDDDFDLCMKMLNDEHVAAVPGSPFGVEGYIRLSCTIPSERIREGVRRIEAYLG